MLHRIIVFALIAATASVGIAACATNPADSVPAAQVNAVPTDQGAAESTPVAEPTQMPEITEAAETILPVGQFPITGTLQFLASKVTATHDVEFKNWSGTYESDGTLPGTKIAFAAVVDSLVVDEDSRGPMTGRLEAHLRSDEFFDVAKFPQATFTSTSIAEGVDATQFPDAAGATHTVTGTLEIRGMTKEISFPVTVVNDGAGNYAARTEFSLNRQDFGLVYPGAPDDLIRDEVVMVVDGSISVPN